MSPTFRMALTKYICSKFSFKSYHKYAPYKYKCLFFGLVYQTLSRYVEVRIVVFVLFQSTNLVFIVMKMFRLKFISWLITANLARWLLVPTRFVTNTCAVSVVLSIRTTTAT
uniref:Uncharacterized protein n=1 Tax=Cacopsylla melanoneura TaxID=428564 RepID=A0A8D9AJG6_9HEMI